MRKDIDDSPHLPKETDAQSPEERCVTVTPEQGTKISVSMILVAVVMRGVTSVEDLENVLTGQTSEIVPYLINSANNPEVEWQMVLAEAERYLECPLENFFSQPWPIVNKLRIVLAQCAGVKNLE